MSQKRELLLNTALDLFYRQGIHSVGINEVIKVSGVAKKTLYSHFNGKDDLIMAALQQRHQLFMSWLEGKLEEITSNDELIDVLFGSLQSWFTGNEKLLGAFRGCFFINTSAEFSNPESQISRYCCYHKEQVRRLIQSKLSKDSPDLLNVICLLKEGAITTAYMTGESTEIVQSSVRILHSLEC
ncbi:putative HTH-type transcriptional regulator YxaF [BD1-7 clade bacterium]|uniref:Putative HTH-type transcriptional regulator YxaF n=1 Tax=BD1-7 clade bacterium TaxID=2029982 RepID=A0A5S9Q5I6_9GAMM|nr:putative HTH-type transcriptional regulator YxaF [BD1-7 clade bacterium]CAA0112994.1 putative HTH-type transcriptional regulator YxaF [BD1-7 clade bacterium]